jgi:hypothetical protein
MISSRTLKVNIFDRNQVLRMCDVKPEKGEQHIKMPLCSELAGSLNIILAKWSHPYLKTEIYRLRFDYLFKMAFWVVKLSIKNASEYFLKTIKILNLALYCYFGGLFCVSNLTDSLNREELYNITMTLAVNIAKFQVDF